MEFTHLTEAEFRELEPLYDQARREIPALPSISITAVQRLYRLGYNRAARLREALAQYGVVDYDQMTGAFTAKPPTVTGPNNAPA
jgi:DNA segregation ATPase FtsK/SpoIIIE-like protein